MLNVTLRRKFGTPPMGMSSSKVRGLKPTFESPRGYTGHVGRPTKKSLREGIDKILFIK